MICRPFYSLALGLISGDSSLLPTQVHVLSDSLAPPSFLRPFRLIIYIIIKSCSDTVKYRKQAEDFFLKPLDGLVYEITSANLRGRRMGGGGCGRGVRVGLLFEIKPTGLVFKVILYISKSTKTIIPNENFFLQ